MQFTDFLKLNRSGWLDSVKIVYFRMLPRGAQVDKVRSEINAGVLKNYGRLTTLEVDRENRTITSNLDLKGESAGIQIRVSNYQLIQNGKDNPVLEYGRIEVSRAWLDALVQTLVKKNVIPGRIEIKNPLYQCVVKSIF